MDQDTGEDRRTVLIAFSIFMALGEERTRMQGEIKDLRGVKRENESLKEEIIRLKDVSRHFHEHARAADPASIHEPEALAWKALFADIARQDVKEEAKQEFRREINAEAKQEIIQEVREETKQEVKTAKEEQATTQHRNTTASAASPTLPTLASPSSVSIGTEQQSYKTTNSSHEGLPGATTPRLGNQAVWEIRRIRHVH